jgi:hypothetical protein
LISPPPPPPLLSLKTREMTQNLECLTSLDSSWKQKNRKKMKLFSFERGAGEEGDVLNHAKMSKLIVLSWLGTDGKFNFPTLKNRKCSMKFPKK